MSDIPPAFLTYMNGLKAHDVPMVASTVSEDLAFVSPRGTLNKLQFLSLLRALYTAFPDWHYEHSEPEIDEQAIVVQWHQWGTHLGTFALPGLDPVPATGRTVTIPKQYFFYRLRDGHIQEIRPDKVPGGAPEGIFQQIGAAI